MTKPHAKTLQERMGFTDGDLKTPGHDAIMLWLDDQVKVSLQDWLDIDPRWADFWTGELLSDEVAQAWAGYLALSQQAVPVLRTHVDQAQDNWHRYPDRDDTYFLDRLNQAKATLADCEGLLVAPPAVWPLPDFPGIHVVRTQWESPVNTDRAYTVGFVDLEVSYERPYLSLKKKPPTARLLLDAMDAGS